LRILNQDGEQNTNGSLEVFKGMLEHGITTRSTSAWMMLWPDTVSKLTMLVHSGYTVEGTMAYCAMKHGEAKYREVVSRSLW
jgi:hypothetical protein